MRQEVHKNINEFVLRWPILLLMDLRACPESVVHIPRETPLEKTDFPSPTVSVADSFLAGAGGSLCRHSRTNEERASVEKLPRSGTSAGKRLDCTWILLKD